MHVQQQPACGPSGISFSSFQASMIFAALLQCISHMIVGIFYTVILQKRATFLVTILFCKINISTYLDFETPRYFVQNFLHHKEKYAL